MKFTKDAAYIVFNLKDGSTVHDTYTVFRLDVEKLSKNLMRDINDGIYVRLDGHEAVYLKEVESFEITNYDELLELKLEREKETEEE